MRAGGDDGIRAGLLPGGGETASDDVAAAGDLPYQTLLSLNATQRIASIVESSDDAIVSKDLNGVIISWNKGAERIFGYMAEEVVGKPITILIPPDRQDEEPRILERIRRGERVDHYETVRMRKHGSRVDISLTISPVKNTEGKIIGASKVARDITERKRSEAQISILAREAEHRAKNVLATVLATVHLSNADTPEGLKRTIEGRIQALANVHRLFVETRWTGAELNSLVKEELAAYCQDGEGRVRIDGPYLMMRRTSLRQLRLPCTSLPPTRPNTGLCRSPKDMFKSSGRVRQTHASSFAGPRRVVRRSSRRRVRASARA
jgi:PAS domain S-box-containing protein